MYFSASSLVKKSARQLIYLKQKNVKKRPTKRQRAGNEYAAKVATSKYVEMRGSYKTASDYWIYFSFDEVKPKKNHTELIEIKQVQRGSPHWYLEQSLLQCAFYRALFLKSNKRLQTATFAQKRFVARKLNLQGKKTFSILKFGNKKYKIYIRNSGAILDFFTHKAEIISSLDYEKALDFDKRFKHKEFHHLRKFFTFRLT